MPLFHQVTFLHPSLPFRRRSSASTTASYSGSFSERSDSISTSATSPLSSSPPADNDSYLSGSRSLLKCARCLTHLCHTSQIISKGFTGRYGRAYLVAPPTDMNGSAPDDTPRHDRKNDNLLNTHSHKPQPRQLVTGAHTVSDVSCLVCGTVIGWKYVAAEEDSQKYKVGKYILETKKVSKAVCWENDQDLIEDGGDAEIEFDSQDEDECEDLFAGVWSESLARKRRKLKSWRPAGKSATMPALQ